MNLDKRWYALQVRSQYERIASAALEAKGYEAFLPTFSKPGKRVRGCVETGRPLFPGYLFCRIVIDVCAKIVTTPGVSRIVGYGKEPVSVSDEEIAGIEGMVKSGVAGQSCGYMPAGCRVRVESGPLRGIDGVLVSDTTGRKLVLSISLLQRSVAAVLEPDTILTQLPERLPAGTALHHALVQRSLSQNNFFR